MTTAKTAIGVMVLGGLLLGVNAVSSQDWPQWRGPNRDAKATGFEAPKTWPKELTQKWKVKVGEGVASPALVGDRLYVFVRDGDDEVIRCLEAATGKEVWHKGYPAQPPTRPAAGFNNEFVGPRSSPTVAEGKVVTQGAGGTLCCFDAADGKELWRKDDFKGYRPVFFVSSSPIIADGLCIAQLGGKENGQFNGKQNGGIVAYDLATGAEKWKWTVDGPGYASPVLANLGGTKAIVAETDGNIVALGVADGKQLWKTGFKVQYNACTPMVDGQTVIYSGAAGRGGMRGGRGGGGGGGGSGPAGGTKAVKLEKKGDQLAAEDLWTNPDTAVMFNTPVVKNGLVFGISNDNKIFCINEQTGKTAWSTAVGGGGGGGGGGGRGGRGGMGGGGYGSVVDAGSVLLALTPTGQLTVFEPSDKEFKEIAKYKVADGNAYAYPVLSGNRIFIKDKDSLILWTIE
jgi:outer membrane protein assembly factor BamB